VVMERSEWLARHGWMVCSIYGHCRSAPASRTGCRSMTNVERSGLLTKPTGPQTTLHQGRPLSSQVATKNWMCTHAREDD